VTELIAMAFRQIHEYEQCLSRGSTDRLHAIAAPLIGYALFLFG
jgi:hypothetical protein